MKENEGEQRRVKKNEIDRTKNELEQRRIDERE